MLACCGLLQAQTQPAATTKPASKYLRFVPDNQGGGVLQASVVTFRNSTGVTVDLIGAVHIADAQFFHDLERTFPQYDALLYEMVSPKNYVPVRRPTSRPSASYRSLGWVSMLQQFMKDKLDLTFQLDEIDYTKPNFVHADLDVETFLQMQTDRGETIFGLMLQQMLHEMMQPQADQPQLDLGDILLALGQPDQARQLKLLLAKQFDHIDEMIAGLGGPDGSVILTERNKAALKVLRERIALGDKKIGIFFGAAHLRGMEETMTHDMGFKQVGEPKWRTAWDMTTKAPATQP
jgi:hypothetical protein